MRANIGRNAARALLAMGRVVAAPALAFLASVRSGPTVDGRSWIARSLLLAQSAEPPAAG